MKKYLYWLPRILSILFIAFISMFALDVFAPEHTVWQNLLGFLIHLIPTYVVVITLLLAWKKELTGGIIFIIVGLAFIFLFRFQLASIIYISVPMFLIGGLFLLNKFYQR